MAEPRGSSIRAQTFEPRGSSVRAQTGVEKIEANEFDGLKAPKLLSAKPVTGASKEKHRLENKRRRQTKQLRQPEVNYWASHVGQFTVPTKSSGPVNYRGKMCPKGLAACHPAGELLLKYATGGCPTNTGRPWTLEEIIAAIEKGPHVSALVPEAIEQHLRELQEKVRHRQAKVVLWDDIKHNPPEKLKVSPLAINPHKSRLF